MISQHHDASESPGLTPRIEEAAYTISPAVPPLALSVPASAPEIQIQMQVHVAHVPVRRSTTTEEGLISPAPQRSTSTNNSTGPGKDGSGDTGTSAGPASEADGTAVRSPGAAISPRQWHGGRNGPDTDADDAPAAGSPTSVAAVRLEPMTAAPLSLEQRNAGRTFAVAGGSNRGRRASAEYTSLVRATFCGSQRSLTSLLFNPLCSPPPFPQRQRPRRRVWLRDRGRCRAEPCG